MTFTLLPAVDVAGGQVVRLGRDERRGEPARPHPLEAALGWQAGGAAWIHLVDLDAAYGRGSNAELLAGVIDALDLPVQLSGGIVDDTSLSRALATGCARVVLGTAALVTPDWCGRVIGIHGERIAVALDVRVTAAADGGVQHRLAARGGTGDGGDLWEALARLDRFGCARYVVTEVGRDGALNGPDVALCEAVAGATSAGVIASGGIASLADLVVLAQAAVSRPNIEGAVVGTALHAGRFTLPEALDAVRDVG